MKRSVEHVIRPLLLSTAALLGVASLGAVAQAPPLVDTFAVRTGPRAAISGGAPAPGSILTGRTVGEQFCNALHCIVLTSTSGQVNELNSLQSQGLVTLEPLPDAHKLFFQHATFDAVTRTFDRDFPGRLDLPANSAAAQYVVLFKSYPERQWLDQLEGLGVVAMEPVPSMGYYIYGPRTVISGLLASFPSIYAVFEVPAGLKRFNIDTRSEGDDDSPAPTTLSVVGSRRDLVLDLLRTASGQEPALAYKTGPIQAFTAFLGRADALTFSQLPEVVSISRNTLKGGPSDERSNQIIGGTWQTPGTAWPQPLPNPPLPGNTGSPKYWDNYLAQFSNLTVNGYHPDLSHQIIGFTDTGVDSGLRRAGQSYCPPYLLTPNGTCRLVFTTDITNNFNTLDTRANDTLYHGTLTTSIAAGFASSTSNGRDSGTNGGYAFTQGVAQNAKVAMCQFWAYCNGTDDDSTYRRVGEAQPFREFGYQQNLRYALVELSSSAALPDGVTGPGARIFNHSWNFDAINYEDVAILLDQTTRSLAMANFSFDGTNQWYGAAAPGLHIVSAGNYPEFYGSSQEVTAPGPAKNVITVGASETYNQESYTAGCTYNASGYADNFLQIPDFSRIGFPNLRLKPDLIAPGTRSYGRRSIEWDPTCGAGLCNMDLDGTNQYAWHNGTSFSAPVVTGAAAVTKEWLGLLKKPASYTASPAMVKATLIATARTLTTQQACSSGCQPCCSYCGEMRPSPDLYQGWGGVTLDHHFRAANNYFFYDQGTVLTTNGQAWGQILTITDVTKDINLALVWTDRASAPTVATSVNLVNDLDLWVVAWDGVQAYNWYGDYYYTSRNSCARNGYTLRNPSPVVYDRKNNVERINIKASDIPAGVTTIIVYVTAYSLTGDGINPGSNNVFQQDFALMVDNAHQ